MSTVNAAAHPQAGTRRSGRGICLALAPAALVVALSACAKKDVKSEMSRVRSWTATTKLATELRGLGSTNDAVTKQLLQRAEQTHAREEQELARLAKTDSQRVAARGLLDSLQREIARLRQVAR